jgi:hypothetical protein
MNDDQTMRRSWAGRVVSVILTGAIVGAALAFAISSS